MQLENSFTVGAPPSRVFAYLLDVNKIVGCVPGAELSEVVDPTTFKGKVKIKVGPITVAYSGTARIVGRDDANHAATLEAEGRETTGPGSARAKARAGPPVTIVVSRAGFCSKVAPGTHVTVRVGPLALNEQHAPSVAHATWVKRFLLSNCQVRHFTVTIAPPLAVQVHASPTVRPTDYGASDNRELGAEVGFSFSAKQ